MTGARELRLSAPAMAGAAIVLVGIGAAAGWFLTVSGRDRTMTAPVATAPALPTAARTPDAPPSEVSLTLTADAVTRAGIVIAPVTAAGSQPAVVRAPGVVQANANRQVVVTALASGRVTEVRAAAGDRVARGQTLASIDSPDLADAQARYLSARAELDAHERELQRTQRLVDIGAASRQELERVHAQHTTLRTSVQSTRTRLLVLGMPASSVDALVAAGQLEAVVTVSAPLSGVMTERKVNPGQNVDATVPLFTVTDLSTVWVVADVYEKDLAATRLGAVATVSGEGRTFQGRVSYIDPQVRADTRTAQVRIELPNPDGSLRPGRYVDVSVTAEGAGSPLAVIPKAAVQMVGDREVVYLVDQSRPNTFLERPVEIAHTSEDTAQIVSGVQPGDRVVSNGSFFLRAEAERLGLRGRRSSSAQKP